VWRYLDGSDGINWEGYGSEIWEESRVVINWRRLSLSWEIEGTIKTYKWPLIFKSWSEIIRNFELFVLISSKVSYLGWKIWIFIIISFLCNLLTNWTYSYRWGWVAIKIQRKAIRTHRKWWKNHKISSRTHYHTIKMQFYYLVSGIGINKSYPD
jgi:hypothetical protein